MYWTKRVTHIFTGLTFCITQQWGAGKLPTSQKARLIFSLLSLPLLLTISELPDMDYVTFMKLARNGTFSLVGFNLTTQLNVCNHLLVGHCRNTSFQQRIAYYGPTTVSRSHPEQTVACCKAPLGDGSTLFLSQTVSHRTSLDQMQSIHCPGQHTYRPVPHRASARDLIDCQIQSRDPHQQNMWMTSHRQELLIWFHPFMPRRCWVVHEAHGLLQPLLTLLHLTVCCTEQMLQCLENDYSRKCSDLTHTKQFRWTFFILIKLSIEIDVLFSFSVRVIV